MPSRSVARILGKGGATINDIKDTTGAQIDVDKASDDSAVANITVRGTKKAIAEAKSVEEIRRLERSLREGYLPEMESVGA